MSDDMAPTPEGVLREAIEGAICRVFEHARETTDEIEGGQVLGAGWLHTAGSIDQWLHDRLAFELSETLPGLVEHATEALLRCPPATPCPDVLADRDGNCTACGKAVYPPGERP